MFGIYTFDDDEWLFIHTWLVALVAEYAPMDRLMAFHRRPVAISDESLREKYIRHSGWDIIVERPRCVVSMFHYEQSKKKKNH